MNAVQGYAVERGIQTTAHGSQSTATLGEIAKHAEENAERIARAIDVLGTLRARIAATVRGEQPGVPVHASRIESTPPVGGIHGSLLRTLAATDQLQAIIEDIGSLV